jgi:hypothetical protein
MKADADIINNARDAMERLQDRLDDDNEPLRGWMFPNEFLVALTRLTLSINTLKEDVEPCKMCRCLN